MQDDSQHLKIAFPNGLEVDLRALLARVPGWADAPDLRLERLEGLTNLNYAVTVHGECFVLRVSGPNAAWLGIDREAEREALAAAARSGLGAEVVAYLLPEGHLVTRFIEGRTWTFAEYRRPENLRRVVEAVKRLHHSPPIAVTFSPFCRIKDYARRARNLHVLLPENFCAVMERVCAIENRWCRAACALDPAARGFCHNDLFSVNMFIDTNDAVRFIDWEFAGMGDIYNDLATLVYAYDSDGMLSAEERDFLLECYFGEPTPLRRARLEDMMFIVLAFAGMWGLLQHGFRLQAGAPCVENGFGYLDYATDIFAQIMQQ